MVYTVGGIKMGDYVIDFPKQKKSAETSKKVKKYRNKDIKTNKRWTKFSTQKEKYERRILCLGPVQKNLSELMG